MVGRELCKARGADAADCLRIFPAELCRRFVRCHLHGDGDDNAAHSDAQEILSKAKAIADEQGVEAATLIVTGDPASVFVELSRNYNLIVIGNRGKGGLAERLLGTTSSSLPAYAYCPIVVVPYTDDDGNLMHLNNTITKVAVGSDESSGV